MAFPLNNNRNAPRSSFSLPVFLSFGSQITLEGQIKDLSLKSAFINIRSSIRMDLHDELKFNIGSPSDSLENKIHGSARISRVAAGEGIAIYFTEMDATSSGRLQRLIGTTI